MKKVILYLLAIILMSLCILPVAADKLSDAQREKSDIDNQLNNLSGKKKEVNSKLKSTINDKNYIEQVKTEQEKELEAKQNEKKLLDQEVNALNEELKASETDYNQKQELLKKRLKIMYENSDRSFVETFVESNSITDFFGKIELISFISKKDNELIESLYTAKKDLEYKKHEKIDEKQEKQKLASDLNQKINELSGKISRAENDIDKYNSIKVQLEAQEDSLIKQSEEIGDLIRSFKKNGGKYAGGSMLWPLPSCTQITSYYGMRIHPIFKTRKMHTGIDINAAMGASVVAANKGTVIVASWQGGYGNAVIIDHGGGITTLYGHNSRLLVKVGDKVEKGQVISKAGSTGYSTGPHLHFEVRKNGSTVNPLEYVSQ